MANTTIYPYGNDGTLPSSIGLINDLTTGGVNRALTAEMGKEIGTILSQYPTAALVEEDGIYFVDEFLNVGARIESNGLFAFNQLNATSN